MMIDRFPGCCDRVGPVNARLRCRRNSEEAPRYSDLVCPALIGERRAVLARDRFRRWINDREARMFVGRLEEEVERWAEPTDVLALTGDPRTITWSRSTAAAVLVC